VLHGDGSPEGLVYAGQGSIYLRRDNSGGTQLYQKTTGIHLNSGWVSTAGTAIAPTGTITTYAGPTAPSGYLLCDGTAVSRTTYSDLFAICGTLYGSGDGSTTFNIPDLRGRVAAGFAAAGGHADVSTLGNNDLQAEANRRPTHRTSLSDPSHSHYMGNQSGSGYAGVGAAGPNSGNATVPSTTGITIGSGVAGDALDTPSYLVVNHIIKT